MIIDNLDLLGVPIVPTKANPPLIVDTNTMLALAIPSQGLKPIAGRLTEGIQRDRSANLINRVSGSGGAINYYAPHFSGFSLAVKGTYAPLTLI